MTIDTGIKALDLFAPLPSSGVVSLAAPAGHGALVLLLEVLHRTNARLVALGAQTRTRDPREFAAMFHEVLTPERRETSLLDASEPADEPLQQHLGPHHDAATWSVLWERSHLWRSEP